MTVQTEAKITEMLSNTQTLVERTNNALSVIDKANAKALKDISNASSSFITTFSTDLVKSVGIGGDFASLNEALNWASSLQALNSAKVIITLLPNYVITKQITLKNLSLPHVIITSNNEVINIDIDMSNKDSWYFAFVIERSLLSFINIKFKALKNNTKLIFNHNSDLYAKSFMADGFLSTFYHYRNSLVLEDCVLVNNTKALYLYNSFVECRKCTFNTNSLAIENIQADLSCWENTFTNNTLIFSHSRAAITKIRDCTIDSNTTEANIAYNTLTPNGIIFK